MASANKTSEIFRIAIFSITTLFGENRQAHCITTMTFARALQSCCAVVLVVLAVP
jgi:hypothetical protein